MMSPDATGAPRGRAIRIDATHQRLDTALLDLARQGGIELILAAPIPRTMSAPKVGGRHSIEDALALLLAGSGLTYRRSADGAYIVATLARAPAEPEAVAMPDILVIGRKTQNSDIRRRENDIQPYKVWTSEDVEHAHSSNIDDFLRSRITSNAQLGSAIQNGDGSNSSEVDLRGLGSGQTLVLVDGRRLPASATVGGVAFQPDLNGISLSAIERIEVLNSTAGGIYGPGATAGVVNIVLKRDYHGVDLGLNYGMSNRGDAQTRRIDARIGLSSESDTTQLMIAASRTWGPSLRRGDRDFTPRARALQQDRDPAGFAAAPPVSGSVNIGSTAGAVLTLDPAYGGASLGATTTSVPATYGGVATDGGALYRVNAGRIDSALAPDAAGTERTLLTRTRLASLLVNLRQEVTDTLQVYGDLLVLENAGRAIVPRSSRLIAIEADAPINPFQQAIVVSFPLPGQEAVNSLRVRTSRLTGGLILDLPQTWKANADFSVGRVMFRSQSVGPSVSVAGALADPLAGQTALLAALAPFTKDDSYRWRRRTNSSDLTLRLAGPIVQLGGGPMSLSVLGEERRETYPTSVVTLAQIKGLATASFATRATSLSTEFRAPLIDRFTGIAGLRGLELQVAVRYDINRSIVPGNVRSPGRSAKTDTMAFTAGLRFFPIDGVMLRASIASGFLPPTAELTTTRTLSYTSNMTVAEQTTLPTSIASVPGAPDPLRGGAGLGTETVVSVITGASPRLQSEKAQSVSAGIVLTPAVLEGARLSVDYTRIDKRREIVSIHSSDEAYFLAHESEFPGRVIRAPLSDADRAKGYTVGPVTIIDTTLFNVGKTIVEAVDVQLDYSIPTETIGDFRVHAAGSWQPRLSRRINPLSATINSVGFADGPLKWRANAGVDWRRGSLDLGIIATYYGRYMAARSDDSAAVAAQTALLQSSSNIPAQVYFDVFAARHVVLPGSPAGLRSLDIRAGMQNLFDHRPPIIVDPATANYSLYGDPRLRRFDLCVVGHF